MVGFALLRSSVEIGLLQSQYMLEDFILFAEHQPEHHVELLTFVLNPIFSTSSRFVLKEAFRLMRASCLYLRLAPSTPIPGILSELVQAHAYRFCYTIIIDTMASSPRACRRTAAAAAAATASM